MSIVERVVEFLESAPQTCLNPSATQAGAGAAEPNRVDRAASDSKWPLDCPEGEHLAAEPKTTIDAGRPPPRTTIRTHRIDLDHLRKQGMVTPDGERTPIAEQFRHIKRRILANVDNPKAGVPANLVLLTSALPGEGKTFCSINLAISIAQEMDHTVLLVDGDITKPSLPQVLGIVADKGLMDVLLDRQIDLAEVLWNTNIDKLTLLTAGTAHRNSTEALASDAMHALLREMAARYHDRIVIFDAPPILATSEASVLASQVGQVVVVVEEGKTPEAALKAALGRIESRNVAGLVLNKCKGPGLGRYDGYGYGYGYGARSGG